MNKPKSKTKAFFGVVVTLVPPLGPQDFRWVRYRGILGLPAPPLLSLWAKRTSAKSCCGVDQNNERGWVKTQGPGDKAITETGARKVIDGDEGGAEKEQGQYGEGSVTNPEEKN